MRLANCPLSVQHLSQAKCPVDGPSDTVLTLHGPGDPGAVLAWDDDRGRGANARIVRKLQPGEYWLTVRHKDGNATGAYRRSDTSET